MISYLLEIVITAPVSAMISLKVEPCLPTTAPIAAFSTAMVIVEDVERVVDAYSRSPDRLVESPWRREEDPLLWLSLSLSSLSLSRPKVGKDRPAPCGAAKNSVLD